MVVVLLRIIIVHVLAAPQQQQHQQSATAKSNAQHSAQNYLGYSRRASATENFAPTISVPCTRRSSYELERVCECVCASV